MPSLATGNVPVQYQTLSGGFRGTDETVKLMTQLAMGKFGARSPKIRALARNIIVAAGVREKDYTNEALALGTWVRDNIRYMKDVFGQETLSPPEEIAFNMHAGDCDDQSILLAALLGAIGVPSRFKVMGLTKGQYSHVYLQACPAGTWITMDPIMGDKPIGWEVPQARRAIEKTYPTNGPDGWVGSGVNGMGHLGYIADPRVVAHLDESTIPRNAGKGINPPGSPARPNYVTMDSMLDTDVPVDALMAFHPNQNIPQQIQPPVAAQMRPGLKRLANGQLVQAYGPAGAPAGRIPQAMDDGFGLQGDQVIGPDALAGMSMLADINNQSVPSHMTVTAMSQRPEGVDLQFTRAAMIVDPTQGDKIMRNGQMSLAQRPHVRPIQNLEGVDGYGTVGDMLPGIGYIGATTGPGIAEGATGTELTTMAATGPQADLPEGSAPTSNRAGALLTAAAVIGLGLYLIRSKKR